MLPRTKRRPLTADDLMRRQEMGTRKRQKRVRDEDESSQGSDDHSSEDSQSVELSALDEDEDDQNSASEAPIQDEEEDAISSRFSFKPRQSTLTKENMAPSRVSSLPQNFVDLGVSSSLVSAMKNMSIHTPTEIQVACIPPLLDGTYFDHSKPHS